MPLTIPTLPPITRSILAIDPGITTGLAWRAPDGSYHTATAKDSFQDVWKELDPGLIELVVYENFSAQTISKYGLETVRLIGSIQGVCWARGIRTHVQQPQFRRAFLDAASKHLTTAHGASGFVVHQTDALAHLMAFIHHNRHRFVLTNTGRATTRRR